jgi:cyclic pyranopterin phosphate synthase
MTASVQDMLQRGAATLRLSITGENNLDCFYFRPMGLTRDLFQPTNLIQPSDVSKLVKIVGEMGVKRVLISGGEPLLRKDAPNFIKSSYAHKGIEEVLLNTNGTYLKTYADLLRKMGLKKVDINCDTINYEKYHSITKKDDLFRVLDGIDKVEKLHFPQIRFNVILMRGINDDEIIDIARITKDQKIHIRFVEYTPINGDDPYYERVKLGVLEAKRRISNYQRLTQIHDFESDEPEVCFKFNQAVGKVSFVSQIQVRKERSAPTIVFNADGALYNEIAPNRPYPILADLRKDAKDVKLHKLIEKVIRFDGTETKAKTSSKKSTIKAKGASKRTKAKMPSKKSTASKGRLASSQASANA